MADAVQHEQRRETAERAPEQKTVKAPAGMASALLDLQEAAGNQSALAMVQTKLVVGAAADPAEAEADALADAVVDRLRGVGANDGNGDGNGDGPHVRRVHGGTGTDPLGGVELGAETTSQLDRARSGGRALPGVVRDRMEAGFGQDFSSVRVHDDAQSDHLNRSLQAKAFTAGQDIFFSKGSLQPHTKDGEHLLAHELAHVVQQGGAIGRRSIRRKMWTAAKFAEATNEGTFTLKGDAQKNIELMIADYLKLEAAHGVVSATDTPKAINLLLQMRQAVDWYLGAHTKTVKDEHGLDKQEEDPKRKKRMKGMKDFKLFVDAETSALQSQQTAKKKDGTAGTATTELDAKEKSKGFIKLEAKYAGESAKSTFNKIGGYIGKLVPEAGDKTAIEVELKLPVDPTGVGFVGGRFKAEIEKDKYVKIRAELAVTGGVNVGVAELKGEIGGYIEAQADNGADAMELVSYALYRRFRESHALPRGAANYMWGGSTDDEGFGKAEAWSLALEKRLFDIKEDVAQFEGEKNAGTKAAKVKKHQADVADRRMKLYVESGGLVGAKAKVSAAVLSAEVSIAYNEGRRIDFESLKNTKGGAGSVNKVSSDKAATFASAVSGGTRGAQEVVGRTSRTLKMATALEAGFGKIGKVGGTMNWDLNYLSDGKKPATIEIAGSDLTFAVKGQVSISELLGPHWGTYIGTLTDETMKQVRKKLLPKAEAEAGEATAKKKAPSKGPGAVLDTITQNAGTIIKVVKNAEEVSAHIKDTVVPPEQVPGMLEKHGVKQSSMTGIEMKLKLSFLNDDGEFEINKTGDISADIPKLLAVKYTSSKRILKLSWSGAGWTVS
jgi:hypothetical protein